VELKEFFLNSLLSFYLTGEILTDMLLHLKNSVILIWLVMIVISVVFILITLKSINYRNTISANDFTITTEKIIVGHQYTVNTFHARAPEKGLIVYISDANPPILAIDYAKKFAELSYYVASIDSQVLLAGLTEADNHCAQIAEVLHTISSQLQVLYHIDKDELPIIVGDNKGASLVYVALTQTEKRYFHAGISIDFNLTDALKSQPCLFAAGDTYSGVRVNSTVPAKKLSSNWYIFQNTVDAKNVDVKHFILPISNAKLTFVDRDSTSPITAGAITAGPISGALQILQWLDPRLKDQITPENSDGNLPLVEVPAENNVRNVMAILITGDGGWAEIDKNVANNLVKNGISTVALDSLSYFWRGRNPEEVTSDIEHIIALYRDKWHIKKFILVGYSFGADVLPFIANRLSEKNKADVALVALLAMGKTATFEFHLSSWIDADTHANQLPLLPELEKMAWANSVCIYGLDDKDSACVQAGNAGAKAIGMTGDHHFDEQYDLLVKHIVSNIKPDN
jgi:type IV secretory pathway VirJ component